MLIYILGILTGVILSFGARLADKDITRVVERYGKSGGLSQPKPVVLQPSPDQTLEEKVGEFMDEMNGV